MAKTDTQQIEEWAVRRALRALDYTNHSEQYENTVYKAYLSDFMLADQKRAINEVALSFMQLREECAGVLDEAAKNAGIFADQDMRGLAARIRKLHTNA